MEECPVCSNQDATLATLSNRDGTEVSCPRCGNFAYTGIDHNNYVKHLEGNRQRAVLSYAIRQTQGGTERPLFEKDEIKRILEADYLPGPFEQSENLILWIGEKQETPGMQVSLVFLEQLGVVGAVSPDDIIYLVKQLRDAGFIEMTGLSVDRGEFLLTFQGWEKYDKILSGKTDSRKAFMAMKYGEEQLDTLFENHWFPAVKKTGFELVRLDKAPEAGSIINRMRNEIRKARFLLAELTGDNLGAYWEAGYAEGLGKPVVYLCEKEHFENVKTHFDVNQQTTVVWDSENLVAAEKNLKLIIRNTLPAEAKLED